jgi:hypothetical protein
MILGSLICFVVPMVKFALDFNISRFAILCMYTLNKKINLCIFHVMSFRPVDCRGQSLSIRS